MEDIILSMIGLGVCLLIFWFGYGIWMLAKAQASSTWSLGAARVLELGMSYTAVDGSLLKWPTIQYRYEFRGHSYTASCIAFHSTFVSLWTTVARRFPGLEVGSDVNIHINPDEPAQAVLEPGVHWKNYVDLLIPLLLGAISGLGFLLPPNFWMVV